MMENLDIIILTSVVFTLFVVFIIAVYREMKHVEKNPNKKLINGGPRVALLKFIQKIFDEDEIKKMKPEQRVQMYKTFKRTISDMESDGVYFPEEIKDELVRRKNELTCEYSGLPSVETYFEDEQYSGHS